MPVTPRYDWHQDFNSISIEIYGPGFRAEHLQVADLYLGLNSSPYLLGLDLHQSVNSEECQVVVLPAGLQIKLEKSEQGLWPELCLQSEPDQLRIRRKQTLEQARAREEQKRKQLLQEKADAKSKAQKHVWDEEDRRRALIQQFKQTEENEAKSDLAQWAQSSENRTALNAIDSSHHIDEGYVRQIPAAKAIDETDSGIRDAIRDNRNDGSVEKAERPLPVVRKNPAVLVRFTSISDRCGPVARDPNEDDEFAVVPSVSKATDDVTECHTQLLFEKGQKFQSCSDYLSAISAFTAVLNQSSTHSLALLNRALCYLSLAGFRGDALTKKYDRIRKCIADCNLVLAGKCSLKLRSKLLQTRARANALFGNYSSSISDYEDAANCIDAAADSDLISELERAMSLFNRVQSQDVIDTDIQKMDLDQISTVVNVYPTNIKYLIRKAELQNGIGQHDQALDDLTECLAILDDPVLGRQVLDQDLDDITARIYQLRGEAHLALDRNRQAGDDFSSAIRHGLNPDLVRKQQATIQKRLAVHLPESVDQSATDAKEKDQLQSLLDSAADSFKTGDALRAKRLFSEALRLQPPKEVQARILSNRAAAELCLEQFDACIRDSTACLELGGTSDPVHQATTLTRRASAYSSIGSLDSAKNDLNAALAMLDPGSSLAQQITMDLQSLTE